ncbi:MAG: SDH family Clp fold serine proteinase [Candidatus Nezhaarchaeales archaeon]
MALNGFFIDPMVLMFFILLLIVIFTPSLQWRALKAARLRLLRNLEEKYGFRAITLIHRQEKVGFFGIPVYRFIDIDDSEAVLRAIRTTPSDKPIALILHTPGGLVLAAAQIAMALKRHPAKKVVIVPHYAMSGGTLIALAADEIWMSPDAVLGPLDPQLSMGGNIMVPAPSIIKAAKQKGQQASDQTLVLADVAEKAIKEIQDFIVMLLNDKMPRDKAEKIAKVLTEGEWTHDYPITIDKAKALELPVKEEVPAEVYELMDLYPQAPINRPGVEYIPYPVVPHRYEERRLAK